MTPEQLTRAASEMEAALARLDIEPGITTEAELAQDDAEILPALVNGQPTNTPVHDSGMSDEREMLPVLRVLSCSQIKTAESRLV
jgi:hypothetical protein